MTFQKLSAGAIQCRPQWDGMTSYCQSLLLYESLEMK